MYEDNQLDDIAPWLMVAITVLGVFLRVLLLGTKGMGLEETFSVWLANQPVSELLQWVARIDQNPPLYYLLLHYWIELYGDTAYSVRLLSALLGAGAIPVLYLAGKRLAGKGVGLTAALFLALSPLHILLAQEARMYTLLTFNLAVAMLTLVHLLTDVNAARPIGSQVWAFLRNRHTSAPLEPETREQFSYREELRNQVGWRAWLYRQRLAWSRRMAVHAVGTDLAWLGFIVFSAAALLSHTTAIFFLIAANIYVFALALICRLKKPATLTALHSPSILNWFIAQVGILILWSPWIGKLSQQIPRLYQEFWLPQPGWDTVFEVFRSFFNFSIVTRPDSVQLMWIVYLLAIALGVIYWRKKLAYISFLVTLFLVPFLGELIVSLRQPVFAGQTLLWITLPLFLILAAGIAQLKYRPVMILLMIVFATNNLFATSDNFRFLQKEDWGTAAGFVAYFAKQDDLILFNAAWTQIPFDYYFKAYEQQYSLQVEKHGLPVDLFDNGLLQPRMTESDLPRLSRLLEGRQRTWLVYARNTYTDPIGLIPQALGEQMQVTRQRPFMGGQVFLYERP